MISVKSVMNHDCKDMIKKNMISIEKLVNNFSKYFNNSRQPLDQKAEEGIPGLYKMFSIFNISDKTPP